MYRVTNVHMHETQKGPTRKNKIRKQLFSTARGLKLNILPLRLLNVLICLKVSYVLCQLVRVNVHDVNE